MAIFDFQQTLALLESWGLTDILLPFLLLFVVTFAILQKTKILGADKKNFNVIIALVVSLMVVIPHALGTYPAGFDVVEIMNLVIPQISLIIVAILMLLLLLGLFGGAKIPGAVAAIAGLVVLFIFIGTTRWLYNIDFVYDFLGTEIISFVIVILVFGLIIWFITSEPKESKMADKVEGWISKFLSGGK